MKIECSPYILEAKESLSHRSSELTRKGALLRIYFPDGLIGYTDCHPCPELGDKLLLDQLKLLNQGHYTPLIQCSLQMARLDAEARAESKHLLSDCKVPLSHYLIPNFLNWHESDFKQLLEDGHTHLKLKLGRHVEEEAKELVKTFSGLPFKLRLDFNEALGETRFTEFLKHIEPIKHSIDFIEDPFPFDPVKWKAIQEQFGVALACDRHVAVALNHPGSAARLIVKPAIHTQGWIQSLPADQVIITSYLDHPLGQVAAAYMAGQVKSHAIHPAGLLSHQSYKVNPFSQWLTWKGAHFEPSPGTGFGFDEELAQLSWRLLPG